MSRLVNTVRILCEGIIEKNEQYKTEKRWFPHNAKKSLVDNFNTTAFLDREKNMIIITARWEIELESFDEIEPAILKEFIRNKQIIKQSYPHSTEYHVALFENDIQIRQGSIDVKPNPINEIFGKNAYDCANELIIKDKQAYVSRDRMHGKWDSLYYLTRATEEELKKVISVLTEMI